MRTTRSLPFAAAVAALTLAGGTAALAAPLESVPATPSAQRHTVTSGHAGSPEGAAALLMDAWVRGDRVAARQVASDQAVAALFAAPPPERPRPLRCRATPLGILCAHELTGDRAPTVRAAAPSRAHMVTMQVKPATPSGYEVTAVDFS